MWVLLSLVDVLRHVGIHGLCEQSPTIAPFVGNPLRLGCG
jgi:hypothetical protein